MVERNLAHGIEKAEGWELFSISGGEVGGKIYWKNNIVNWSRVGKLQCFINWKTFEQSAFYAIVVAGLQKLKYLIQPNLYMYHTRLCVKTQQSDHWKKERMILIAQRVLFIKFGKSSANTRVVEWMTALPNYN